MAVFDSLTAAGLSVTRVDSAKYFLRIRGVMLSTLLLPLKDARLVTQSPFQPQEAGNQ